MSGGDPRALVPAVAEVFAQTRETVLEAGIVPRELKELCARYLAEDPDVVGHAEDAERYSESERAALAWTFAIGWDDAAATPELWARLHRCFSEPELVELGYAIAFMLGQTHWMQTRESA